MLEALFKNKTPNIERLPSFGFSKLQDGYCYSVPIVDGQFNLIVTVPHFGAINAEVVEASSNELYVLHRVSGACGSFVGRVRNEYLDALTSIAETCFVYDSFKSDCSRKVIEYISHKYNDEFEYLWKKFPQNAIVRRKDNAKWYAALLVISTKKLGLKDHRTIDIIDLRMDAKSIESVIDGKRYFPGYHMNKKHWVTICLDGSVPIEEIFQRIDASYELAEKS